MRRNSFADEVASQTEEEYNAVRELQRTFDGTVAAAPGVKLPKQIKEQIASAIKTGHTQLDESGKIGHVYVGSKYYVYEAYDDGIISVEKVFTHEQLNIHDTDYAQGGQHDGTGQTRDQRAVGLDKNERGPLPLGEKYFPDGLRKDQGHDQLAERESGRDRGGDGYEGVGAEQSPVSEITYGPDYAHWRNVVKEDPDYSLADDLTPELREEFVKSFDAQFGEGAAEAMFKTREQMKRAKPSAKPKT